MTTSMREIGKEIVPVVILGFFLYVAFNGANYSDTFWRSVQTLLQAAAIAFAYWVGGLYGDAQDKAWKNYLYIIYGGGIIALLGWGSYSVTVEGEYPIEITSSQRSENTLFIFIIFLVPALYGAYKKRKPN